MRLRVGRYNHMPIPWGLLIPLRYILSLLEDPSRRQQFERQSQIYRTCAVGVGVGGFGHKWSVAMYMWV